MVPPFWQSGTVLFLPVATSFCQGLFSKLFNFEHTRHLLCARLDHHWAHQANQAPVTGFTHLARSRLQYPKGTANDRSCEMPIDQKACDKRALFCERLATQTHSPVSARALLEIAAQWRRIGEENNSVENLLKLLDGLGFPGSLTADGGELPEKPSEGDGHA